MTDWKSGDYSYFDKPEDERLPSVEAPEITSDWKSGDYSYFDSPQETSSVELETSVTDDLTEDTPSLASRVWERLRHAEGGVMRDLAVLGRQLGGDNKFLDELDLWGESLQAHSRDAIGEEEMAKIEGELQKEFFEPIDPEKPEWDFRKPFDFSNLQRGEAGWGTAGWLAVETAIPTVLSIMGGGAAGRVTMGALSKLPSVKVLAQTAKAGKAAELAGGADDVIKAGQRATKILNRIEGTVAGTAYGASEGLFGAAAAGRGWNEQVDQADFGTMLKTSPFARETYDAALEEGMPREEAEKYTRESVKDVGRGGLMRNTFITTSLGGAPAGALMKGIMIRTPFSAPFAKGKLRGLAKGAIAEGVVEEGPQSAFERLWNNLATQEYLDESVDASMGIFSDAVKGVVGGAMVGGPIGGVAAPTKAKAERIADEKKNANDNLKLEVHSRLAASSLIENHGWAPEQVVATISPILEEFAETGNIVKAAADLKFLEVNGRQRELGLDNVAQTTEGFGNLDVIIEEEAGQERNGKTLKYPSGRIAGTVGADRMNIDIVGPGTGNRIFIVEKLDENGEFEQHKVLYGFESEAEALDAFYSTWGRDEYDNRGEMTEVSDVELEQQLAWWTAENSETLGPAIDEPMSPEEDIALRKDSDLEAGINQLQSQLDRVKNEDGSYPLEAQSMLDRLQVLRDEQERRAKQEVPRGTLQTDLQQVQGEERQADAGVLPEVSRGVHEGEQAEAQSAEAGTEVEGERKVVRKRVPEEGEDQETPLSLREQEGGNAPSRLQQAARSAVAVQGASSGAASSIRPSKAKGAAEGAIDVDYLHLSNTPELQTLKGEKHGTSSTPSTRRVVGKGKTRNRVYVYAQSENMYGQRGVTGNETGVVGPPRSPHVYSGTAQNLYDVDADPLNLLQGAKKLDEDMEDAILEAGYEGWYHQNYPGVRGGMGVVLNKDIAAMYHGKAGSTAVNALLEEPTASQHLVTWETIPGRVSPFYAAAQLLSQEELLQLHREMLVGVVIEKTLRRDMVASKIGVPSTLVVERVGGYDGQVMPNMEISFETAEQANLYSQIIKIIYDQDAVPWFKADPNGENHGLILEPETAPSPEQLRLFQIQMEDNVSSEAGFSVLPDGSIAIVNFGGMPDEAFNQAVIKSAQSSLPHVTITPFRQNGEYNGQSQAEAKRIIDRASRKGGPSDLLRWVYTRKAAAAYRAQQFFAALPQDHPARQAYENQEVAPEPAPQSALFSLAQAYAPMLSELPDGFYSALMYTVEKAEGMPKKGSLAIKQWLDGQQKKGNLKKEERDWIGIDDFLKTRPDITRVEVQEFVKQNQVAMVEIVKTDEDTFEDEYYDTIEELDELGIYGADIIEAGEDSFYIQVPADSWGRRNGYQLTERDRVESHMTGDYHLDIEGRVDVAPEDFQLQQYTKEEGLAEALMAEAEELTVNDPWTGEMGPMRDYRTEDVAKLLLDLEYKVEYYVDLPGGVQYRLVPAETSFDQRTEGENRNFYYKLLKKTSDTEWTHIDDVTGDIFQEAMEEIGDVYIERKKRGVEYADYTLEGGEEQRELLMQIPDINYNSPHWSEDGIIIHVRFNTRRVPSQDPHDIEIGRIAERTVTQKVLFIEEVQSDLHQAGREEGYRRRYDGEAQVRRRKEIAAILEDNDMLGFDTTGEGIANLLQMTPIDAEAVLSEQMHDNAWSVFSWELNTDEEAQRVRQLLYELRVENNKRNDSGVPDAPFKNTNTWSMVVMKRMIRWAVDNDYDAIAWTTGDRQNERWGLEKYVDSIEWKPDGPRSPERPQQTGTLQVWPKHGYGPQTYDIAEGEIKNYIGQELANRLLEKERENADLINSFEIVQIKDTGDDIQRVETASAELDTMYPSVKFEDRWVIIDQNGEYLREIGGGIHDFVTDDVARTFIQKEVGMNVTLENVNLITGGGGMRGFYDRTLVNNVNKFVKKWGGLVQPFGRLFNIGEVGVSGDTAMAAQGIPRPEREAYWEKLTPEERDAMRNRILDTVPRNAQGEIIEAGHTLYSEPGHFLKITDDMRDAAAEGFALFSLGENATKQDHQQANEHARRLYDRIDWTQIDTDTEIAFAGVSKEEIQDAIVEWASKGVLSKYFRRWFGKSQTTDSFGTPLTFFHGSPRNDIEKFKLEKSYRGFISLSTSADFASSFSNFVDPNWYPMDFSEYEHAGTQATVYPVYVKADKIFDFRNKAIRRSYARWLKEAYKVENQDQIERELDMLKEGDWAVIESNRVRKFMHARGYDAFYMMEGGALNIGVFDPRNIKSATGNIGTFNNETADTIFSLDPNEVGNELSRRLNLYQLRAHLQREVKPEATRKSILAHIEDGLKRGLFDRRALRSLSGKETSLKQVLQRIDASVREGEPISARDALSPVVVQNEINRIMESWENPPDSNGVHVIADYQGAPLYIQKQIEGMRAERRVEGFVDPFTSEIYIVAGNIGSIETLHKVFTEEALGHYGLRGFFGADLNQFLDEVSPNLIDSPAWNKLLKDYTQIAAMLKSKSAKERQQGRRLATEELLAKLDVDQTTWQKFVAWVRAWLRKHGLITNYTEGDLRRVMMQVHNRIKNGTTPHPWGRRNHAPSMGGAVPFAIGWHGSFANFDEFDEAFIGTGVGAAARGYGFYVSLDREIAEGYMGSSPSVRERGFLYKVDVPDEAVNNMLDWNAPVDEQPEVVKAAIEAFPWVQKTLREWEQSYGKDRLKGEHLYRIFAFRRSNGMSTDQRDASKVLESHGVRGIKYTDARTLVPQRGLIRGLVDSIRNRDQNLVVFNKADISIKTRNGKPVSIKTPRGRVYPMTTLKVGDEWAVQLSDGSIAEERYQTPQEAYDAAQALSEELDTTVFSIAPMKEYRDRYPPTVEKEERVDPVTGKAYMGKGKSPLGEAFKKTRAKIIDDMKKEGFDPYFDPAERYDAEAEEYPVQMDTRAMTPAKKATISAIRKRVKTAGARRRLQEAYDMGVAQGGNDMWYAMGQLEQEFINEYGEREGRREFQRRFIDAMAATTSGNAPAANFLVAMFMNYLSNRGTIPNDVLLPEPIGAPRIGSNIRSYRELVEQGMEFKDSMPKMHNFAANLSGWDWMATIDAQMLEIITPLLKKQNKIRPNMKFAYEELVIEMAEENGVSPREFQEVAWGGFKYMKDGYIGKPMIQIVNEAIERTSRLTDVEPAEVVRRGIVRSEMPVYALRRVQGRDEELAIVNNKIAKAHSEMTVLDRVSHWMRTIHSAIAAGDFVWGLKQGSLDDAAVVERYERELFGDILDASISPYKAMHTVKNLPSVMAAISKVGIPIYRDGAFQPAQDGRKGFIEIFRPLYEHPDGDLLELWEGYAAARRANELIQQTNKDGTSREKLFTQDEIDKLLALGEEYPEFDQVFQDWKRFNTQLLDLAVERGVLSEDERDAWMDNDYVPFFRAMEEIEGVDQKVGFGQIRAGVANQASGIKRLHGSEKKLGNIVENMWFNTASLVDKIYKNTAMERVVDMLEGVAMHQISMPVEAVRVTNDQLARALKQAGLLSDKKGTPLQQVQAMTAAQRKKWSTVFRRVIPTAPNVVGVMRNGKMQYFEVSDEMLLSTLKGLGAEGLTGLMKAMGMSKSLLTRMVTLDPAFMIANWMRDTLSAWVTSDANFMPVADSVRAMGDVFGEKGSYIQMMMSGSGGGGFYDLTGGNVGRVLREELSHGGRHWAHAAWLGYLKLGAASENSNRLAIANRILKKGGTVAEAMYQAQDIMNFTMSGDYNATKFLIRTVPFLNARLQGLYRLYRGMKQHPVGFTLKGGAIMFASLALLARNWDDDDYERLEGWQKDINWNFFINGNHYAIPKPFEVGVIFGTLPERLGRLLLGRDDLGVSKDALARAFGETFAMNPVPQLFKPVLEQMMDYNFFMQSPIVGLSLSGLEPSATHMQFNPWTSEAAKRIGEAMPEWAGKAQSPRRIEHLVRAYTGTVGLYTMNSIDWMIRQVDRDVPAQPTTGWHEKPVFRRFFKGPADTARYNKYTQQLYDVIDESNSAQRAFNMLAEQGRREEAIQMFKDRYPLVDQSGKATEGSGRKELLKIQNAIREINTAQRAIMNSRTMDGDEKRERLDELQLRRHEIMAGAAVLLEKLDILREEGPQ